MINEMESVSSDRVKNIREQTTKTFGKEALVDFSGKNIIPVPSFSTGSMLINKALGIGGWPQGRMIEIAGAPSSAKSTVTLHAMAEMQKTGRLVGLCEPENCFDPFYATNIGVDLNTLFLTQPDSAEQGLSIIEDWIKTGEFGLIAVDSLDAMVPQMITESDYGTSTMALTARLISTANRRLNPLCKKYNTTLIWVNQYRSSLNPYGPSEVTGGGKSVPYYASVRAKLKQKEKEAGTGGSPAGMFEISFIKNKVAVPFTSCQFMVEYGKGIVKENELVDLGVEYGLVTKGGAWYTIGEERFQGKQKAIEFFKENSDIRDAIEKQVRDKMHE